MKVKFTAKYENKEYGLKAYAFETPDFIEIVHDTYFLNVFRLDCVKGEWKIFDRCIETDYTVYEDVTHLFDLEDIIKQMKEIENKIPCEQKQYEEYIKTMIDMLLEGGELQITTIDLNIIEKSLDGEFEFENLAIKENEYVSTVYDVKLKS